MIRQGYEGEMVVNGITYNQPMIAHPQLSEVEIANVVNYINHAWGNDYGEVSINQIREWLEPCPKPY
jgi:mono/diheme cytochrome c family protein